MSKKQNFLKDGTVFVKKASIKLMTSSEQGKHLLFEIKIFSLKVVLVLSASAKFEWNWIKDE